MKASLTLGILLGMFFVTWLPFFVANIVQVMPPLGVGESPLLGGPEIPPPLTPHPQSWGGRGQAATESVFAVSHHAGWGALRPGSRMSPAPSRPCVAASPWGSLTSSRGWATAAAP